MASSGARAAAERYYKIMLALFKAEEIRGQVVKLARGPRYLSLGVRLADPRQLARAIALAEPLALACHCPAVLAQRSQADPGLLSYQYQLPERFWLEVTRAGLAGLGVGLGEGRRQIDYGWDPPHAGCFGTTGSGKSESVRTILTALFTAHRPGELLAVIVDPHKDFEDFANCAHLAAPIDPGGGEALSWAGQELARRQEANERTAPRLVVVIDEAEDALAGDPRGLAVTKAVARGGRKYGVHLLISTQDAKEKTLPGLVALVNNRFVGLCANGQISANLTGQAGVQAHKLTGRGDFAHVAGAVVERLQFAKVGPADLERLPRVEAVTAPELDPEDTPAVLNLRAGGRPPVELSAGKVASYLWHDPDLVSAAVAEEQMGLRRVAHERHRDFAKGIRAALDILDEQEGGYWND